MTETEFLEHLGKRLHVLKENERDDILSEYAQHIEMKMESGLSEEEAIRDFGDLEELAAEILDAYHVNPDYNRRTVSIDKGRISRSLTSAGNRVRDFWRRWAERLDGLIHRGPQNRFRSILKCCLILMVLFVVYLPLLLLDLYIGDLLYRYLDPPFDSLASGGVIVGFHLCYLVFAVSVLYSLMWKNRRHETGQETENWRPMDDGGDGWIKARGRFLEFGGRVKQLFVLPGFSAKERTVKTGGAGYYMKKLWKIIGAVLIWIIRLGALCLLAPVLLLTLFLLVACGTLVVLSVIGYPVIGFTILSLGGLLSAAAFLCLACSLLFPGKVRSEV